MEKVKDFHWYQPSTRNETALKRECEKRKVDRLNPKEKKEQPRGYHGRFASE